MAAKKNKRANPRGAPHRSLPKFKIEPVVEVTSELDPECPRCGEIPNEEGQTVSSGDQGTFTCSCGAVVAWMAKISYTCTAPAEPVTRPAGAR